MTGTTNGFRCLGRLAAMNYSRAGACALEVEQMMRTSA